MVGVGVLLARIIHPFDPLSCNRHSVVIGIAKLVMKRLCAKYFGPAILIFDTDYAIDFIGILAAHPFSGHFSTSLLMLAYPSRYLLFSRETSSSFYFTSVQLSRTLLFVIMVLAVLPTLLLYL